MLPVKKMVGVIKCMLPVKIVVGVIKRMLPVKIVVGDNQVCAPCKHLWLGVSNCMFYVGNCNWG